MRLKSLGSVPASGLRLAEVASATQAGAVGRALAAQVRRANAGRYRDAVSLRIQCEALTPPANSC